MHLAAIAINQALGNVGKTVVYTETVNPMPSIQGQDIVSLVNDMKAGKVEWLLILNANPVYTAPVDLHFEQALNKVKTTVHLGSHFNETAVVTEWHINGAHYLENWSDTRAYDGTATVIQPMIDPLYGGKSAHDVIQSMLDNPDTLALRGGAQDLAGKPGNGRRGTRLAQGAPRRHGGGNGFPAKDGFRQRLADLPVTAANRAGWNGRGHLPCGSQRLRRALCERRLAAGNTQAGHQHVMGQRGADELPHAGEIWTGGTGRGGDRIERKHGHGAGHGGSGSPRWLGHAVPGLCAAATAAGLPAGWALMRTRSELPTLLLFASGATMKKTGQTYEFAVTKSHYTDHRSIEAGGDGSGDHSLEGNEAMTRGIIRYATLDEFKQNPNFAHEEEQVPDDPEPDKACSATGATTRTPGAWPST